MLPSSSDNFCWCHSHWKISHYGVNGDGHKCNRVQCQGFIVGLEFTQATSHPELRHCPRCHHCQAQDSRAKHPNPFELKSISSLLKMSNFSQW